MVAVLRWVVSAIFNLFLTFLLFLYIILSHAMVELQEAEKPIFAIIDTMQVNVPSAPWTDYPISSKGMG